jgi:very-short-patch-repair endonuclease
VLTDDQGVSIQTPLATAVHCLRTMPFDEGLAVADSALRSGRIDRDELLAGIAAAPRIGRARAQAVARAADGRAANAFESCLRAICLDVDGLHVEPQAGIGPYRVDLADRRRRLVIEADSRTWHAGPREHDADIRRYTTLVRWGWLVIRFSYHDVIHDPGYVAEVLRDVLLLGARAA